MERPAGYTSLNVALHWLIAVLVAVQFFGHEIMVETWRALREGTPVDTATAIRVHVVPGSLILALALVRLWDQRTRSRSLHPPGQPAALTALAKATHAGLWTLIIAMPLLGALAWAGGQGWAARVHSALRLPLLLLIALHVAGALTQHFYFKSDVLKAMLKPARR